MVTISAIFRISIALFLSMTIVIFFTVFKLDDTTHTSRGQHIMKFVNIHTTKIYSNEEIDNKSNTVDDVVKKEKPNDNLKDLVPPGIDKLDRIDDVIKQKEERNAMEISEELFLKAQEEQSEELLRLAAKENMLEKLNGSPVIAEELELGEEEKIGDNEGQKGSDDDKLAEEMVEGDKTWVSWGNMDQTTYLTLLTAASIASSVICHPLHVIMMRQQVGAMKASGGKLFVCFAH